MSQEFRIPLEKQEVRGRKARFHELNEFVRARTGWLTSIAGAVQVTMETLPGSTLPDELRLLGYEVTAIGEGERIIAGAIEEKFVIGPDGELQPLTFGSTRALTMTQHHAGIARVVRYSFDLR